MPFTVSKPEIIGIDINFDAAKTQDVLTALQELSYVLDTDRFPVRAEFSHPEFGFLDIHPFVIEEGNVKQANPEGGYWEFPPEFFGTAVFEGRVIPCISLEGQKAFHSGYEPREKDIHDIRTLELIATSTDRLIVCHRAVKTDFAKQP